MVNNIVTCMYIHTFLSLFMYRYFYYAHLFLENSSIFSHYFFTWIFGITWTITYSQKTSQFKELCWVILGYFGPHFSVSLYSLRAVKPFLIKVCEDVFCITSILATLKKSPVVFFSISWEPFGFLWKYAHTLSIILWWFSE